MDYMATETQRATTRLWMADRDMNSLRLAQEVDSDNTAGEQIRKVFDNYFDLVGDVSGVTTHTQAEEWAQGLRAKGHFPVPKVLNLREAGHQVITRLYRPQLLGLVALTDEHIKVASPVLADVMSLYRTQLRSRFVSTVSLSYLDIAARECIDDKRLDHEYSRVMGGFSSAAISSYFDTRSQEDGFLASMQSAAEERRELLLRVLPPVLQSPVDLRPWEAAE